MAASSRSDREIVASLDPRYHTHSEKEFDVVRHVLEDRLGREDARLEVELEEAGRAYEVISGELAGKVMANYNSFVGGLNGVRELRAELQTALAQTAQARVRLAEASRATRPGLELVACVRRRQRVLQVAAQLERMRWVRDALHRLEALLEGTQQPDFPEAIRLCNEASVRLQALDGRLAALGALRVGLQARYERLAACMDRALVAQCVRFDPPAFDQLLHAYRLLGRLERLQEAAPKAFQRLVPAAARAQLKGLELRAFLELPPPPSPARPPPIRQLVLEFHKEAGGEALLARIWGLLAQLAELMHNHRCMQAHLLRLQAQPQPPQEQQQQQQHHPAGPADEEAAAQLGHALGRARRSVWDDMQRCVALLLAPSAALAQLKADAVVELVEAAARFAQLGEEFSQARAPQLQEAVARLARSHFAVLHSARLDDLRTLLEHDTWAPCPLPSPAAPPDLLPDLRALLRALPTLTAPAAPAPSLLDQWALAGNPFIRRPPADQPPSPTDDTATQQQQQQQQQQQNGRETVLEVEAEKEALWEDGRTSGDSSAKREGPVVASSALAVGKWATRYMLLLRQLQVIAHEVLQALRQLLYYYLFTVFSFFANAPAERAPLPTRLRLQLNHIRDQLTNSSASSAAQPPPPSSQSQPQASSPASAAVDGEGSRHPITLASVRPSDLEAGGEVAAVTRACVAAESLAWLRSVMEAAKEPLLLSVPKAQLQALADLYGPAGPLVCLEDLRQYVYKVQAARFFNLESVANSISATRFEIKEVNTESPYVGEMLRDIRAAQNRLQGLDARYALPIWTALLSLVGDALVEGYSRVRRCTNEGRALMALDFRTLLMSLRRMQLPATMQPAYVENYIKAFYEEDVVAWTAQHPEYSSKQLQSLIQLKKKGWSIPF
jgi:hypothetical protein